MRKEPVGQISILFLLLVLQSAICTADAAVKPTMACVQNGLTMSTSPRSVTVQAGSVYINDRLVSVAAAKQFEVAPEPAQKQRLDAIYVTPEGQVGVATGSPHKYAPEPAQTPDGAVVLAQLLVPGPAPLTDNDILPISRDGTHMFFADRDLNEKALARTLTKLKAGQPVRILFWGDSITCGANATKPEFGYAARTETQLRKLYPNAEITCKNLGIGGTTIVSRIPSIEPELKSFHPDLVVIEFINDIQFPTERIVPLYERFFQMSHVYGFEVLYVDPFFPNPGLLNLHSTLEVSLTPYFNFVRKTARQYNWALADAARRWQTLDREGTRSDLLMNDGVVHLNNRGHEMLSEEVFKCFR